MIYMGRSRRARLFTYQKRATSAGRTSFSKVSLSQVSLWLICLLVSLALTGQSIAGEADEQTSPWFSSHQVGIRLGGWANQGGLPADSIDGDSPATFIETDFSNGSFYFEGFFGYRISSALMSEVSLGIVSRGDVIFVEASGEASFGTLLIYPILVKLKLYPLSTLPAKFHPYVFAGGGLYYGRHDIQIAQGFDSFLRQRFGEASETTFNYVLGGGIDWPLASIVAMDLQVQYMPIDFSEELIGVRDYSTFTITVGVKYLFSFDEK